MNGGRNKVLKKECLALYRLLQARESGRGQPYTDTGELDREHRQPNRSDSYSRPQQTSSVFDFVNLLKLLNLVYVMCLMDVIVR